MTEEQLKYRIRNIIYYKYIDDRPKAQYIHVLRQLRQDLNQLNTEWSTKVFNSIPKYITDQDAVINSLRQWIEDN